MSANPVRQSGGSRLKTEVNGRVRKAQLVQHVGIDCVRPSHVEIGTCAVLLRLEIWQFSRIIEKIWKQIGTIVEIPRRQLITIRSYEIHAEIPLQIIGSESRLAP